VYFGIGDPNLPGARPYAQWRVSEALAKVAPNGPVDRWLGQQWIVFTFTIWEHDYRCRLAAAHGVSPSAIAHPLLGDLRLLRNDVVHHGGIATDRNAGRCAVLRWFRPGDDIAITGERFVEFVDLFPWQELASPPPDLQQSETVSESGH
jgi:hypothetical protein